MARPEKIRKNQVRREIDVRDTGARTANTISQVKRRTTVVRMAVAKLALIPATPTLARMAVIPAKRAERMDQRSQLFSKLAMACEMNRYYIGPAPDDWEAICRRSGSNCEFQSPIRGRLLSNPASPALLTV